MNVAIEKIESTARSPELSSLTAALGCFLFFIFAFALNHRLFHFEDRFPPLPAEDIARKDPALYRVLSFGHLASAVDWIWIKTLTESEVVKTQGQTHTTLYYDLDLLTELDPLFAEAYTAGANLLAIVQNDGLGAKALLLKGDQFRKSGLAALPESYRSDYWRNPWQIPVLLAYVYLFELNDLPNAAVYFDEAAQLPGAPHYLAGLQKRLAQPGGQYEVGVKLIGFLISGATDPEVKKGLEKKRSDLFIAQYLDELTRAFADFHRGSPANAWPDFIKSNPQIASHATSSGLIALDPWGGALSVDANGRVITTTPHDGVFGLH